MSASTAVPATSVLYDAAVPSFIEFVRTLSDDEWSTPVHCLPGWDVRDVLSHVAGIPDDALAGRMEGAPGEAWTASQVERNRDLSVDELLDRWTEQYVGFGEVLDAIGEIRPPYDVHAHEHDLRHALGRPANRDSLIVHSASTVMSSGFEHPFPVTINLADGRSFTSAAEGASRKRVTIDNIEAFEVFRSRLGRRSRSQVEAYEWSGADADISIVIGDWFNFGPAVDPIVE